jgi:recombination protein RecR
MAIERTGTFRGRFHVLHGRLSPIRGIGPENLNFAALEKRLSSGEVSELILALSNDIEGEATCHYLREEFSAKFPDVKITRIGFGLPSGGALNFADPATLRSALDSRRDFS